MNVRAIKTRICKEGEDLADFITAHIPTLKEGSVLVVTSKIVALSEGRTAHPRDKERLIREESEWALPTKYGKVTLKDGVLMWNAGIDTSNADGKIILLPKDSFAAAKRIHSSILQNYKVKKLGVIISDSRIMPLRAGVVGIALGYAGFKGIKDYRGKKDIFGDTYRVTRTDVADSLATSAVLLMGEGSEKQPLAIIEGAPVRFGVSDRKELLIDIENDMHRPLFGKLPRRKR